MVDAIRPIQTPHINEPEFLDVPDLFIPFDSITVHCTAVKIPAILIFCTSFPRTSSEKYVYVVEDDYQFNTAWNRVVSRFVNTASCVHGVSNFVMI